MKRLRARKPGAPRRGIAAVAICAGVSLLLPAPALARALVRFVHAVPGAGTATVKVDTGGGYVDLGSIGFAHSTGWRSIRSGRFRWEIEKGGKSLADGTSSVGHGAYDMILLSKSAGVALGVYRATAGRPGTSLLRVIHAAPELGSPEVTLDRRSAVKRLRYTQATPYLPVTPGVHSLGAMRPGDSTPLVSGAPKLLPGVAYSAIVAGTRGQRVRVIMLVDRGAPRARHSAASGGGSGPPGSPTSEVVEPGDSLWSIARGTLPTGASDAAIERKVVEIWNRNAQRVGTGNPNRIFPGQRLILV